MNWQERLQDAYDIIKSQERNIKMLEGVIQKQGEKIIQLERRIEELEGKQKTKEVPSFVQPDKKAKSHKLGSPKGHQGFSRPLPDHFDKKINHKINKCPDCGTKLGKKIGQKNKIY